LALSTSRVGSKAAFADPRKGYFESVKNPSEAARIYRNLLEAQVSRR
jgi:hypothetical protein